MLPPKLPGQGTGVPARFPGHRPHGDTQDQNRPSVARGRRLHPQSRAPHSGPHRSGHGGSCPREPWPATVLGGFWVQPRTQDDGGTSTLLWPVGTFLQTRLAPAGHVATRLVPGSK